MNSLIVGIAVTTFIATFTGGLIIFKFQKTLPYFFAFAAGSIISVSFLDILPESIEIANTTGIPLRYIMITVVSSIFFYSLLERYFLTHHFDEQDSHGHIMGPIGAGSLVVHSFLDGVAIGIAFQASSSIGLIVAFAVICHDITDGINTVVLMLKNKQPTKKAFYFLFMDAIAPLFGVLLASIVLLPPFILVFILSIFAGEFIYIGAASLLPEAYKYTSRKIILSMGIGILLILCLTSLLR